MASGRQLTADEFIARLRADAYDGLDVAGHAVDVHGWMDDGFVATLEGFFAGRDRATPLTIVEVGTWKGRSATTMAATVKRLGFSRASLIAVDTWLGAPEFWTWGLNDPTRGVSLRCSNGYPQVFYTFTKNVKALGHDDVIAPLPLPSLQAVDVLRHYGIVADVIYIDAAHEYDAVKLDLAKYWPLVRDGGGVLFGDDYKAWAGVTRAVDEFAAEQKIKLEVRGVVWILRRGA